MTPLSLYQQIEDLIDKHYNHTPPRLLLEGEGAAKCDSVKIAYRGLISVYKFDIKPNNASNLLPFFKETVSGAHTMCDYVIFCPTETKLHIFLCNLKSENLGNSHNQIHAAHNFVQFIIYTAMRCKGRNHFPSFISFKAIHFMFDVKFFRSTINIKSKPLSEYENGLPYIFRYCKQECDLNKLM